MAAYLGAHAADSLQKALELLVERLDIGVREILQREIVRLKALWKDQVKQESCSRETKRN
jgi:hypothetical protein